MPTSFATVTSTATEHLGRVQVEDLRCTYGRVVAVESTAFDVAPGEHVAILGANGSGKSTLLRSICGLHTETTGSILIDGSIAPPKTARAVCAWIPQRRNPGRFPLLVSELLQSSSNPQVAMESASSLGLGTLMGRAVSTLSGGQFQRALLARAIGSLSGGARVLLADEPSAALDFEGQAEVARIVRGLEVTAIIATHDRAVAKACDRRLEMAAGRLREIA